MVKKKPIDQSTTLCVLKACRIKVKTMYQLSSVKGTQRNKPKHLKAHHTL